MTEQDENLILVNGQAQIVDDILIIILFVESSDLKTANLAVIAFLRHFNLTALDKFNFGCLEGRASQFIDINLLRVLQELLSRILAFDIIFAVSIDAAIMLLRARAPEALCEQVVKASRVVGVNLNYKRPEVGQ